MSPHSLLDKARAILAQPKRDAEPVFIPGGTTPPHAGPSTSPPASGGIQIEPAAPNAKAIYWETGTGQILGPAIPEYLARDGETFWIVTTFEGQTRWINADRLRSKHTFEMQCAVNEVELIQEVSNAKVASRHGTDRAQYGREHHGG